MTQLLLSRRIDPRSGVSLMWGSMHSGSVANAIPRTGEIAGTLRALDAAGWQLAKQLIPELAADIVRPFGVDVDVAVTDGVPPAVNHARGVRRLTRAAEELLGPDAVTTTEQSLGGEDFSWMLQQVPGALARLGVRTQEKSAQTFTSQPSWRMRVHPGRPQGARRGGDHLRASGDLRADSAAETAARCLPCVARAEKLVPSPCPLATRDFTVGVRVGPRPGRGEMRFTRRLGDKSCELYCRGGST